MRKVLMSAAAMLASSLSFSFADVGWKAPRKFNVDRGGATLPSPLTRQLRRQQERLERKGRSL